MSAAGREAGAGPQTLAVLAEIGTLVEVRRRVVGQRLDERRRLSEWAMAAANAVIAALGPPFTRQRCRGEWLRAASILVAAVEALDRRGED